MPRFASLRVVRPAYGFVVLSVLGVLSAAASAAQPTESILPNTTKGWVSSDDIDETRRKFRETELGAWTQDPQMQPFIDDLKKQIYRKMEAAGNTLGIRWDDLEGVYSGEACLCRIQPDPKNKDLHVLALIAYVEGKEKEVEVLLGKIDAQQIKEGAVRSKVTAGGVEMTVYTQKPKDGKPAEKNHYFRKGPFLVAVDHLAVAQGIAGRIGVDASDSLAKVEAFRYCMDRNAKEAGDLKFHARWYLEPFGYAEIVRAMRGHNEKDMLAMLQKQGFSAMQGVGGYVFFATGKEELLHRTYVYAPPVKRTPTDKRTDKWNLAMRMLDFPNGGDLNPQPWAKGDLGAYLTWNWKMKNAFGYSETLIDAIAGEPGVFRDMWDGLKSDKQGPQIDIYAELVDLLGERATLISDVLTPVTTTSERTMVLIEVRDPKIVANTVRKFFEDDDTARKRVVEGIDIWEIVPEDNTAANDELMLEIEGGAFVAAAADDKKKPRKGEEDEERKLPRMAISVVSGHLVVSTHGDYVEQLIRNVKTVGDAGPGLAKLEDYTRVRTALERLGSKDDSFRFFARTEESYKATYEMIRQNKLPQTESMLARLVNAAFGHTEEDGVRKSEIDGSKLPEYSQVTKYLGPTGFYFQTEENGWYVVGCLLKRQP